MPILNGLGEEAWASAKPKDENINGVMASASANNQAKISKATASGQKRVQINWRWQSGRADNCLWANMVGGGHITISRSANSMASKKTRREQK